MDLFGKCMFILLIGFIFFFSIAITYAVVSADFEKEKISKMDCKELRDYIIEREINKQGFPDIAKSLHKYKCEVD